MVGYGPAFMLDAIACSISDCWSTDALSSKTDVWSDCVLLALLFELDDWLDWELSVDDTSWRSSVAVCWAADIVWIIACRRRASDWLIRLVMFCAVAPASSKGSNAVCASLYKSACIELSGSLTPRIDQPRLSTKFAKYDNRRCTSSWL